MQTEQLVLVRSLFTDENGEKKYSLGTGYFIAANLVLTANHVIPEVADSVEVRVEESRRWFTANRIPCWKDITLDAALLTINGSIDNPVLDWYDRSISAAREEFETWSSTAYPVGAVEEINEVEHYVTRGLSGKLYFAGGRGQVERQRLDLTVESPPNDPEKWKGISGAPVFIKNELIGIITKVPSNFSERLSGTPVYELFKEQRFRAAIEPRKLTIPHGAQWAFVITAEQSEAKNLRAVGSALNAVVSSKDNIIGENITNILSSPGSLLNTIEFLCKAPIMVIDATDFQPGIMFLIGLRSVVRRGVTVLVTTKQLREEDLSSIPFNIQEIKLFSLDERSYQQQNLNLSIKDRLIAAIKEGLEQLKINPNYLDLPPFDAVRNPVIVDIPAIEQKILFLCPFDEAYNEAFKFLHNELANLIDKTENIVRMLDITSPQLVGQSLYEHLRWSKVCIIDWSKWLPNVFYELGVRLAASDIAPVNLIDEASLPGTPESTTLEQKELLKKLFQPYNYSTTKRLFPDDLEPCLNRINGKRADGGMDFSLTAIYNNSIYHACLENFDWHQLNIQAPPHITIKRTIEREFGEDRQSVGRYNVLFSNNDEFKKAIENQIRESWLCAWYYLLNRHHRDVFERDALKRNELISLGEAAMEALDTLEYLQFKEEIIEITEQLELNIIGDLETQIERKDVEAVIQVVLDIKKKAKNRRDLNRLKNAKSLLHNTVKRLEQMLQGSGYLTGNQSDKVAIQLSDCYGILGGVYSRFAFEETNSRTKARIFKLSYTAYDAGYKYEKESSVPNSYNLLNRLVTRVLHRPGLLTTSNDPSNEQQQLLSALEEAEQTIEQQLKTERRGDIWALADLGLVKVLRGKEDPVISFAGFLTSAPPAYAYKSLLSTLRPLAEIDTGMKQAFIQVIRHIEAKSSS